MKDIIAVCRERNRTIDGMMRREGETLLDWISGEKEKLLKNRRQEVLLSREDVLDLFGKYAETWISKEAAEQITEVLQHGILYTANHLGGLYSAQSFQGDLCYTRLLRMLDAKVSCVPMVSFGLVPLNSSTFARGIIAYTRTECAEHFAIFPKSPTNAAASLTDAFTADMVRRTRDRAINEIAGFRVRRQIRELMYHLYLREDVLSRKRYADQVPLLGVGIYDRLASMTGGLPYYHMEAETLFTELFLRDYAKKDGFLRELLSNPAFRKSLRETTDGEGRPFSSLLFRGCAKRRCFTMQLSEDGVLCGRNLEGETVRIPLEEDPLRDALAAGTILPHVYLSWLLTGFFRGFTWYGGILQSQYLQDWQKQTCGMLCDAGYPEEAKRREAYDCSGYLSGPVYLLFDTGEGAVNAGPLECMVRCPAPETLEQIFAETDLRSAHEMGMFEFYNDLLLPNEKKEGWYETIARYCKEHYETHTLQHLAMD